MKFRYYIADLYSGSIIGTDDNKTAHDLASCEDFFIVDTEAGVQLLSDGSTHEITEIGR